MKSYYKGKPATTFRALEVKRAAMYKKDLPKVELAEDREGKWMELRRTKKQSNITTWCHKAKRSEISRKKFIPVQGTEICTIGKGLVLHEANPV